LRYRSHLTAFLILLLLNFTFSFAQSDTGRIEGLVLDEQGAAIPGAQVVIRNIDTASQIESRTNEEGRYMVPSLRIGRYMVEVTAPNFRRSVTSDLLLQVNQTIRLDVELRTGQVEEEVRVFGGAPLIESSSSSLGQVVNQQQIADLPLNGRNFTQLATLVPGVTRGTPGSNADGSGGNAETFRLGETGSAAISANGLREQNNNFQLDGIDNNESVVNTIVFFPPVEALEEFRVITSVAPAEFGRGGGAIINAVIKSGTNEFHGSVFEYLRNSALDARPTFAQSKPLFIRNQFGFTFGGPLVRNRTFFFGDYQGLRQRLPIESGHRITVPTERMRRGDFSELLRPDFTGARGANNQPVSIIVHNPVTGLPYEGNVIPSESLNPVAVEFLSLYPLPHLTDRAQGNYYVDRIRKQRFNDGDIRIDHKLTDTQTIFGRVSLANDVQSDPGRIPGFQAGFGAGTNAVRAKSVALNHTKTVNSFVNEARFGYIKQNIEFLPVGYGSNQNREVGIPGPGGLTRDNGLSLIGGGNGQYIEYLGDYGEYKLSERSLQFSDALTWIKGNHTMKFGATIIQRHVTSLQADAAKGFYFYSDAVTTSESTTSPVTGTTGYQVSDMLAGRTKFTATSQPNIDPATTISYENGFYAQDDWRVSKRLTLNLGLRYDRFSPYYEKNNRMSNFDPLTNRIVIAGENGLSRSTVNGDKNNFGPRIGLAYSLTEDNRTVLRGGYGLFYSLDRGGIHNQLTQNPPFITTQYRFSGPGSMVALNEPIPLPDQIDPLNPQLPPGSSLRYLPANNRNTRVAQFNFTFERELTSELALNAAYVGTRGDNVTAVVTRGGFDGSTISTRLTTISNVASSSYDSFQLKLNMRPFHGLSYLASYTAGKATNDSPGPFPGPGGAFRDTPTDPQNLSLDRGPADYDIRHRFTFAGTYDVQLFRKASPFTRAILDGWQLNSIVNLQTGTPFSVFDGVRRARLVQIPILKDRSPDHYLNPLAFVASTSLEDQSGRNILRGPGLATIDMSLFRKFGISEGIELEFRTEAFNLFNTPQYGTPRNNITDADFGQITSTRLNSERQIQLGLRLTF
jgi:outer membrane receptor protein involved in Fe transport